MAEKKTGTKKKLKNVSEGILHVRSTFNNTVITVTDKFGNAICWGSPGKFGFKGNRKSTPYAAQVTAEAVAKIAMDNGIKRVDVKIKGPGMGRETAIRTFMAMGIEIQNISDATPIPHNGCRPKKRRRI